MATTVLALFKDAGEAEAAVRALRSAHFESARLGIVHAGDAHVPRFGWYAFIGSVAGTVGGALPGLVSLVPELENEQRPQLLSVIPRAGQVIPHQPPHRLGIEQPLAAQARGRQHRLQLLP